LSSSAKTLALVPSYAIAIVVRVEVAEEGDCVFWKMLLRTRTPPVMEEAIPKQLGLELVDVVVGAPYRWTEL